MASNTLVKRLLWIYSIFTLYVVVASLLGVAGLVYLPLRMDILLLFTFLVLYWTVIAQRIAVRRQKKRAPPTKPW
jgi:pilus assembly protein TadC